MSAPPTAPHLVPPDPAAEKKREQKGKRRLLVIAGVFALVVGGYFLTQALGAGEETTDDAMVDADVVPLTARVGGQIVAVRVADNATVKKGDVLVELDASELKARVHQAEGELAAAKAQADAADAQAQVAEAAARGGLSTSKAQVTTSRSQVGSAEAQIAAAKAQLARAEAEAKRAAAELERARTLFAASAIAQDRLDATVAANESAQAGLLAARAQLDAATEAKQMAQSRVAEAGGMLDVNAPIEAKIAAARAGAELAHARVTTAEAALELAKLSLSYATIVAPADGTVAKLGARVGQVVSPGSQLGALVPQTSYVVANFKETQVGRMQPGQPVEIEVDAYPGTHFRGVVESIMTGTGGRFSVLAPDNASGNFVKVVQRVPVRIRWDTVPSDRVMRPGQSAVVHVHVGG